MAGLPLLAIGDDRAWLARIDRMLACRGELDWRGAFAPDALPAEKMQSTRLWLVDGDDAATARLCPSDLAPARLYFYSQLDIARLRRCVQLGGSGCLAKRAPPDVVLRAIRAVDVGLFVVEVALFPQVMTGAPSAMDPSQERRAEVAATHWGQLTERQREIVRWAAQGLSNKQIGQQLGISPETVKTHLHHVFDREGISGRIAVLAAYRRATGGRRRDDV